MVDRGLSWAALYLGGAHPTLALVPIVPFMPHAKRDLGFVNDAAAGHEPIRFEHWRVPVQIILLLFSLASMGVTWSSVGPATWIVLSSLIVGKPLGIVLMTFAGVSLGLRAPGGLGYVPIAVLGVAAGIGFTVALFFATAAFPVGNVLDEAKMARY